ARAGHRHRSRRPEARARRRAQPESRVDARRHRARTRPERRARAHAACNSRAPPRVRAARRDGRALRRRPLARHVRRVSHEPSRTAIDFGARVKRREEAAMLWWGWLILGIGLLAVEMFLIDAEFYLVFLGGSATIVGLLALAGVPLPDWAEWLLFAALAIVGLVGVRRRGCTRRCGNAGPGPDGVTPGDRVAVPTRLEPGQTCRVEYRGTSWSARNVDVHAIAAGSEAVISHIDDLTLHIKA